MFDDLIGVPFADRGRGRSGCDCWGLVYLAYAELLGIDLPHCLDGYASHADRAAIAVLVSNGVSAWRSVPPGSERRFDAVLMLHRGAPVHIGLVTRPGRVLHVEAGSASGIDRYRVPRFRYPIEGFYRHEDLWS